MIEALAPTLLVIGFILTLGIGLGRGSTLARAGGSLICGICTVRYLVWRVWVSMPTGQSLLQEGWAWLFLVMECLGLISSLFAYVFMSRTCDRSPEADRAASSPLRGAPTDVFIATYNENYDILERTIVGALSIEHPDLRVWVLDDGSRSWVRDLARDLGALYISRRNGAHAKAGNINNGLRIATSTGRRPEFLLLLDADFVPNRAILRRTLGLFESSDIGIVQTPQHFFNPDPVQANLLATRYWPDEQRFFFNTLLPSKDAWSAAFCCGTSAVIRVAALEQSGGMAVETVTEDMLTSFKMEEYGWRTIFLNERLSLGLAPEGVGEYVSQRVRWCLGAIQQIYTRWSFVGSARLRLVSRLSSLDGVLYWVGTFPFRVMIIGAPVVYWYTGTAVMHCTLYDLCYWLLPSALGGMVFMMFYSELRVMPVISDAMQLLPAFAIMRIVVSGLIAPFGRPFKVTAKGLSSEGVTVQWGPLLPFAVLAVATALGMILSLPRFTPLVVSQAYSVNIAWSLLNIFVLLIAISACIELPRRRMDERFQANESAMLITRSAVHGCVVRDISVGGARVSPPLRSEKIGANGILDLDDGRLRVPFVLVGQDAEWMSVQFSANAEIRRALIGKLFTGAYDNEVPSVRPGPLALAVLRRIFA